MITPFAVMLGNAVLATVLAVLVYLLAKRARHPPLIHVLWVLVLVKLLTPPVLPWPVPVPEMGSTPAPQATPAETSVWDAQERFGEEPLTTWIVLEPTESSAVAPIGIERAAPPARHPIPRRESGWLGLWAVWLGGCVVYLGVCRRRHRRLHRLLRHARPAPASWQQEAEGLARQLGLRRSPSVWQVAGGIPPLVAFGRGGPRIVIPIELLRRVEGKSRSAILLHELAHLRRRDHWVHRLELVVRTIYWWYPVVGWIGRQLHAAEEECCDGVVVNSLPEGRRDYARLLVDMVDFLGAAPRPAVRPRLAMSAFSKLQRRLTMVLRESLPVRLSWRWGLIVVGLALLALPVGVRPADADPPAPEETPSAAAPAEEPKASPAAPKPVPRKPLVHKVPSDGERLEMAVRSHRILTLGADNRIPQVQVDDPEVLQAQPLSPTEIQVWAKRQGVTQITLWDEEKNLHTIYVAVRGQYAIYAIKVKVVELGLDGQSKVLSEPMLRIPEGRGGGHVLVGGELPSPAGIDLTEPLSYGMRFQVAVYRKDGQTYVDGTLRLVDRRKSDRAGVRLEASEVRFVEPVTLGEKISVPLASLRSASARIRLELTVSDENIPGAPEVEAAPQPAPSTSGEVKPDVKTSDKAWQVLGVRLRPIERQEFAKLRTRYRGGMQVAEVRPHSPAAKQGVRQNDVLVGLHVWETTSSEQVDHVLSRPDLEKISPIKFFLLRGNHTLFGHFPVAGPAIY